ncbi:oxygenase [Streptomyces lincolnensis]|uniref:Oxygenase n=1 Tax=Streptomyces lincolnensis TaxID=1915 RepID=A0A1B1MNK8_STRLN|nr:oxygenase [Streptomyces lincolnensis]AXG59055.1 oxygenase [Streptomyces lincolnensis]QMV11648.1 oxygenase [Streptomyces lincolnensis]
MTETVDTTAALEAPVGTHAIWQSSTKVCRVTDFLPAPTADELLRRAASAAQDELLPARVRDNRLDTRMRSSLAHRGFSAPELLTAIDAVVGQVENVLGVSCSGTRPAFTLNVHNDGDFYRAHQDVSSHDVAKGVRAAKRVVTFVYYLHRTPAPFTGGDLRMYDSALPLNAEHDGLRREDCTYRDYAPDHNSVVFFLPSALHEVRPVSCPSGHYADSRFAINGWLCRTDAS